MKNRNTVILKILKNDRKMYITLFVGMILSNIYMQYCVYETFKENNSLKCVFKEKSIVILITFIFILNYSFALCEIISEHIYDFYILKICGEDNMGISVMLFLSIIKIWIKSFTISVMLLFSLLSINSQKTTGFLMVVLVSLLINFILNVVIVEINIYKNVMKLNYSEGINL